MDLDEIFKKIRDLYLARFQAWVDSQRTRSDAELWLEPAWRDNDGNPARLGPLLIPKRIDIALREKATSKMSSVMIGHEMQVMFDPIEASYGNDSCNMEMIIHPFKWDGCRFTFPRSVVYGLSDSNWAPLRHWFEAWFDLEGEDGTVDSPDWCFRGVCHFLSDPEDADDKVSFFVDFGSAPRDAIFTLLDRCLECGVAKVVIGDQ